MGGKGGLRCHQLYCLGSHRSKTLKVGWQEEMGLCYSSHRCPYLFQQMHGASSNLPIAKNTQLLSWRSWFGW